MTLSIIAVLSAIALPRVDWSTAGLIFAQTLCIVLIIAVLEQAAPPADPTPDA